VHVGELQVAHGINGSGRERDAALALRGTQGRFVRGAVSRGVPAAYSDRIPNRKDRTMNTHSTIPAVTEVDRARLHELARERALQLRSEAIDAAWRYLAAALRRQLRPRRPLRTVEA
jgi:hypothetical protein